VSCKHYSHNSNTVLQPLCWRCIHHERDVHEEEHRIYVVRTSNNRVIAAHELYCCLLPQCEALSTSYSGFSDCNNCNVLTGITMLRLKSIHKTYLQKNNPSKDQDQQLKCSVYLKVTKASSNINITRRLHCTPCFHDRLIGNQHDGWQKSASYDESTTIILQIALIHSYQWGMAKTWLQPY